MDIKAVIKEQREELQSIEKRERIINRELLEKATSYLRYPNVLAIVGVRRCGKSIFSYLLAKNKNFGYINFDDERIAGLRTEDLNKILQSFYELYGDIEYVILDEVQNVKKWELFVNRLRRTKKVIITGSNSKLLAGELSTHLTGRYIDIMLSPFSFREYLDLNQIKIQKDYTTREKAEILRHLEGFLTIGGFPEVNKFGKVILSRIYNDIITKDILLRYKIKKIESMRELAKYIITNFCQEASYRKLANILNIKRVSTISHWLSYLEDSFLISKLERFSFKLKQQIIAPKKFYCVDNGIVNMVTFGFSENRGYFIENAVAVELQRTKAQNLTEIYYWKDHQHNEVDFIIKQGREIRQLIQVTYAQNKNEIKDREIKSLIKASQELRCNNLLVITWDYEEERRYRG
ncbi:MAG: ATP-binding protein, partial [Candidatus Omnitrophica bacterium]|nr:ATP-binding protein [Candidatus Omnitrophota bacterium]